MPNLATLMVGLGYDLSALEKGAPEAFRLINTQTAGMSAEMKRSSREGAESFRLIDEALGVHVSRPLTRILTQEFPGFAKGLQSILGISIAGATGLVAFEGIARLLEQGKKLLEVTGALESWKQMLGLVGETAEEVAKEMTAADTVLIANLKHKIEMQDAYNQLVLGLKGGDFERAHLELMKQETAELQKQFAAQMLMVQARANEPGWRGKVANSAVGGALGADTSWGLLSVLGINKTKDMETQQVAANKLAEAMKPLYEAIKKVNDEIAKAQWKIFRDDADAATAAARADLAYLQGDLKRWNDAANEGWKAWMHTNEELEKSIANMRQAGTLAETAARYQKVGITPVVAPVFGTGGGTANEQLTAFSKDTDAQQALIKQAFQSAITPAEEYALKVQELKLAFASLSPELKNTTATQAAYNAELAKLGASATQAELHLQEMTKKLDEMLSHSTSASAGVQAFFLQLQVSSAENGKFAFDLLNSGLKGFEDNLTKMVFDGKAKWKDFFRSMTEEVFKFMLNKDLAGFFQMISGTGVGKGLGLGSLIPSIGGAGLGGGATLTAAGTTLQTGSTLLVSAATTLQAAATTLAGGSGVAGAGGFPNIEALIPGFAAGTDDAPGGMAWVGEQGPELLNLPAGASVKPASSLRGGGDLHIYQIDAKGAEIGVEEKIVRALAAAKPRFIGEALANFSEVQKRTAGQGQR
jgi:lambda family phage tail tape measure protein